MYKLIKTTLLLLFLSSNLNCFACSANVSYTQNLHPENRLILTKLFQECNYPSPDYLKIIQASAENMALPSSVLPVPIDDFFVFGYYPTGYARFNLYCPASKRPFLNDLLRLSGAGFTVPEAIKGQEAFFNPKLGQYKEGSALADIEPIWKAYTFLYPQRKALLDEHIAQKAAHTIELQRLINEKEYELKMLRESLTDQSQYSFDQNIQTTAHTSGHPYKPYPNRPIPSLSPMGASPFSPMAQPQSQRPLPFNSHY